MMMMELQITTHATNPADGLPNATDSTVNLPPRTTSTWQQIARSIDYQLPGPASVTPHGDKIQSGKDYGWGSCGPGPGSRLSPWRAVNGHHLQRGVPRLALSLILPVPLRAEEPAMENRTLGSSPASCVPEQQGNISKPPPLSVSVRLGVGMKTEPQWALSFSSWPSPDQDADLVTSHSSHNVYH